MELETHALSNFDFNSQTPNSSSLDTYISSSETPLTGDRKCQWPQSVGGEIPVDYKTTSLSCTTKAAMTVQKVYRSYRTRRMLADSALVAEELWWQAIDYARLNHSTISFFNVPKPETAASRWNRITLNASKVGKGLSRDVKAQKLAFQHWIEAIDSRHRYGHSLHIYYDEWCKTDAGQPFFYWLDLGDGKKVDLKECPRSKLQKQSIKYLGPQEREHYEYIVVEGKIVHKHTGNHLDTTDWLPGAKWIFVMSTSKRLYAGQVSGKSYRINASFDDYLANSCKNFGFLLLTRKVYYSNAYQKKKGIFHHSSFLAGGATLAAGRLDVKDGILKSISAYSGHYRPTDDSLDSFLSFLKEYGVNLDEVQIRKAKEEDESYEEGQSSESQSVSELSTVSDSPPQVDIPKEEEKDFSLELIRRPQAQEMSSYKRTLSGGLESPRAEVPKTVILQRINSKKSAKSYQLGHQLSLVWSTGAGPRIGCIADYPAELRLQALELTNLSPRPCAASLTPRSPGALVSPTCHSPCLCNGDVTCS